MCVEATGGTSPRPGFALLLVVRDRGPPVDAGRSARSTFPAALDAEGSLHQGARARPFHAFESRRLWQSHGVVAKDRLFTVDGIASNLPNVQWGSCMRLVIVCKTLHTEHPRVPGRSRCCTDTSLARLLLLPPS